MNNKLLKDFELSVNEYFSINYYNHFIKAVFYKNLLQTKFKIMQWY